MKFLTEIVFVISCFNLARSDVYSVENPDGSYTIGGQSDSQGQQANSVLALLTKAAGYTVDNEADIGVQAPSIQVNSHLITEPKNLLTPHLEILELVEVFLRLKGELASKAYAVINDNSELIRSVYNTLVTKIGSLHTFTLTGVKILRKILEFAVTLLGQWQITLPDVSVNLGSLGSFTRPQEAGFAYGLPASLLTNTFYSKK